MECAASRSHTVATTPRNLPNDSEQARILVRLRSWGRFNRLLATILGPSCAENLLPSDWELRSVLEAPIAVAKVSEVAADPGSGCAAADHRQDDGDSGAAASLELSADWPSRLPRSSPRASPHPDSAEKVRGREGNRCLPERRPRRRARPRWT